MRLNACLVLPFEHRRNKCISQLSSLMQKENKICLIKQGSPHVYKHDFFFPSRCKANEIFFQINSDVYLKWTSLLMQCWQLQKTNINTHNNTHSITFHAPILFVVALNLWLYSLLCNHFLELLNVCLLLRQRAFFTSLNVKTNDFSLLLWLWLRG